ncbi:MAG TPA: redoxin domain-containing protein [Fimbriimonadaceae bacterium]|jgi:peroxiredoxin
MKRNIAIALLLAATATSAVVAFAQGTKAAIGAVSPNFTLSASNGKQISLESYRGKFVVLEWTNKDCPFVKKHYNSGNMQATQEKAKEMGAVWFTIISSAPNAQGYMSADQVNQYRTENKVKSVATLLDSQGTVGHMYNARTTPQIVIINPKGEVVYNGAIDDRPSPDPESLNGAKNYALAALKEAMSGQPVAVSTSRPYGCGIKYADE